MLQHAALNVYLCDLVTNAKWIKKCSMQSVFFNYPFYVAGPTSIDWQAWLVLQLNHTHIQPDTQTFTTLNQTPRAAPGEHPNLRNARSFSYLAQTKLGFCIFFNFFQFIGRSRKYFSHCQISVKRNLSGDK